MLGQRSFLHIHDATPASGYPGLPDVATSWTNQRGAAPLGFAAPIPTIVDTDLAQFDEVWAAGGHPHYVFPTSFDELVRITGGTPADVGA